VSALPTTAPKIDPGKLRGLQRVASDDGFLEICAFQSRSALATLLRPKTLLYVPCRPASQRSC
jgi:hypothetical protein